MKTPSTTILNGMPSLVNQQSNFDLNWPIVKCLPSLVVRQEKQLKWEEWLKSIPKLNVPDFENNSTKEKTKKRRLKKSRQIKNCPHVNRKHYAKLMCNVCYHSQARSEKATLCDHKDQMMYAKGMCLKCYQKTYKKQSRMQKKLKSMCDQNKL